MDKKFNYLWQKVKNENYVQTIAVIMSAGQIYIIASLVSQIHTY